LGKTCLYQFAGRCGGAISCQKETFLYLAPPHPGITFQSNGSTSSANRSFYPRAAY